MKTLCQMFHRPGKTTREIKAWFKLRFLLCIELLILPITYSQNLQRWGDTFLAKGLDDTFRKHSGQIVSTPCFAMGLGPNLTMIEDHSVDISAYCYSVRRSLIVLLSYIYTLWYLEVSQIISCSKIPEELRWTKALSYSNYRKMDHVPFSKNFQSTMQDVHASSEIIKPTTVLLDLCILTPHLFLHIRHTTRHRKFMIIQW